MKTCLRLCFVFFVALCLHQSNSYALSDPSASGAGDIGQSPYSALCVEAQSTPYSCEQWQCIKPCIPNGDVCVAMGIDVCRQRVKACEARCGVRE